MNPAKKPRIFICISIFLLSACTGEQDQEQTSPQQGTAESVTEPADLAFSNAYIYTVDAQRSIAQALAIRGNEIIYVGDNEGLQTHIGPETDIRDLGGRMLLPGLHDMHIHATGIVEPDMCDFKGEAMSLEQMVPFLQGCIAHYEIPEGEWLVVLQWLFSQGNQPSEQLPNIRVALDTVSDKHPIILWGDDGHHAAVNSLALANAKDEAGNVVGMNRETINTVFADYREMIAVDETGEPIGGVNESARLLIRPNFDEDMLGLSGETETLMPGVAQKLAASGVTTIQDATTSAKLMEMYDWLANSGHMTFRLRTAFYNDSQEAFELAGVEKIPEQVDRFNALRAMYGSNDLIQANSVKLFADSVLEGNPYATPPTLPVASILGEFRQPLFTVNTEDGAVEINGYVDMESEDCKAVQADPESYRSTEVMKSFGEEHGYQPAQCLTGSGILEHSEEYIFEFVRQMTEAGFHVHIHALSDRGVRVATEAFTEMKALADEKGLTQSMTHIQLAHPDDVNKLGELGIYVAFTYVWAFPDPEYDVMVIPFIDEVKGMADLYNPDHYYMQNVYPVKAVMDAGGVLTWGSDAPVGVRDPIAFLSMQAAVTRETDGIILNPEQRISIHDALAAFTINGARLMGHDTELGSIEAGKKPDLIVLNQNVVELAENGEADRIAETLVDMTVFDGRVVFERDR